MKAFDTVVKRIREARATTRDPVTVPITPEELAAASKAKAPDATATNRLVPLLSHLATASDEKHLHLVVSSDASWHLVTAEHSVECLCEEIAKPGVAAAGGACCDSGDYILHLHDAQSTRADINRIANDYRQRQSPVHVNAVRIEGRVSNGKLYLTR